MLEQHINSPPNHKGQQQYNLLPQNMRANIWYQNKKQDDWTIIVCDNFGME